MKLQLRTFTIGEKWKGVIKMAESNKSIPVIFNLDDSALDSDRELLLMAYHKFQGTGFFPFANTEKIEEVINAVEKEIFSLPFEVIPENGMIRYAQIITGYRDSIFYILRVDQKNSFNQVIRNKFPNLKVQHLNFLGQQTFCFYFIDNPKDLAILGSVFSEWASNLDHPTD